MNQHSVTFKFQNDVSLERRRDILAPFRNSFTYGVNPLRAGEPLDTDYVITFVSEEAATAFMKRIATETSIFVADSVKHKRPK